jgi:hypothetical protein
MMDDVDVESMSIALSLERKKGLGEWGIDRICHDIGLWLLLAVTAAAPFRILDRDRVACTAEAQQAAASNAWASRGGQPECMPLSPFPVNDHKRDDCPLMRHSSFCETHLFFSSRRLAGPVERDGDSWVTAEQQPRGGQKRLAVAGWLSAVCLPSIDDTCGLEKGGQWDQSAECMCVHVSNQQPSHKHCD